MRPEQLCFLACKIYEDDAPTGDFTAVATVTVSP